MEGYWGGNLDNKYVGELLRRQATANPAVNAVARLEAVYEFHHGDDFFTALIRGGSNGVTGKAYLDGVVLAGWRTGASRARGVRPDRHRLRRCASGHCLLRRDQFRWGAPHATEHAARKASGPQASSSLRLCDPSPTFVT